MGKSHFEYHGHNGKDIMQTGIVQKDIMHIDESQTGVMQIGITQKGIIQRVRWSGEVDGSEYCC